MEVWKNSISKVTPILHNRSLLKVYDFPYTRYPKKSVVYTLYKIHLKTSPVKNIKLQLSPGESIKRKSGFSIVKQNLKKNDVLKKSYFSKAFWL